jgi:hypothetical protein
MFGVLRGTDANNATVWLYALSGWWDADGDWCQPLTFPKETMKTQRDLTNYDGTTTRYTSSADALNEDGIDESFQKFGRCAAPVLLTRARARGLTDLELAEVWLYVGGDVSFPHKAEIGSCHQCRRFLGRMLCEVGA